VRGRAFARPRFFGVTSVRRRVSGNVRSSVARAPSPAFPSHDIYDAAGTRCEQDMDYYPYGGVGGRPSLPLAESQKRVPHPSRLFAKGGRQTDRTMGFASHGRVAHLLHRVSPEPQSTQTAGAPCLAVFETWGLSPVSIDKMTPLNLRRVSS
jgi:hypothetical protein